MDNISTLLTFIQTMIWPFIILLILLNFAKPLRNMLTSFNTVLSERGIKLTPGGLEIPGSQDQVENIINEITNPRHYDKIFLQNQPEILYEPISNQSHSDSTAKEVLEQHEKNLVRDIMGTLKKTIQDNPNEPNKEKLLEGLLCDAYISLYFERSFQRILGTQLKLIEKLYQRKDKKLSKESAEMIFNEYYAEKPVTSFDRWCEFLIDSGFIKEKEAAFALTKQGQEFFEYLLGRKYLLNKIG